jgi:hypothetical protein
MLLFGTSVADAQINIGNATGTGLWTIGQGGTLVVNANTVDAAQIFDFSTGNTNSALVIGQTVDGFVAGGNPDIGVTGTDPTIAVGAPNLLQAGGFSGVIQNYRSGDSILLNAGTVTAFSAGAGGVLTLTFAGGGQASLNFITVSGAAANAATLTAAGTQILASSQMPCFCAGTMILTPTGEIAVEALQAGDLVQTWSGQQRRIVWAGMGRTLVTPRNRCDVTPVIVRAGALDDGVPSRDLHVTRHHALLVQDVLVPVEHLINGASIIWDDRAQVVEYYHLELDAHDILVADGAPAESFRDDGNAHQFQNHARRQSGAPMEPCRAVVESGAALDAAWGIVAARVRGRRAAGWTGEADLHLAVDDLRVEGVRSREGTWSFDLPPGFGSIAIGSRTTIPAARNGTDLRRVGVAVREMTFWRHSLGRSVALDNADIGDGWHEMADGHRWTKGLAVVPIRAADWRSPPNRLEITLVDAALSYRRAIG